MGPIGLPEPSRAHRPAELDLDLVGLHDTDIEDLSLHSPLMASTPGALVWAFQLEILLLMSYLSIFFKYKDIFHKKVWQVKEKHHTS